MPSRTGLIVVSAAFKISMTESHENDRNVDLEMNQMPLIKKSLDQNGEMIN